MPTTRTQIRPGAYYDSVVLMQLQKALLALPQVLDAGVVMATDANKELLAQNNLLAPDANAARAEDLLIAVSAENETAAQNALAQIDALLARKRATSDDAYRPKSLENAAQMLPDAQWVLVSTPGKFAAGVARDALNLGKHVFLYSDNVSLEDEIALKNSAREKGLLVMGPDCGTAIINGIGLGFANRVRRGKIGIVGASGTGTQAISVGIHRLGEGISYAIGTGTNDLKDAVGGITTLQALDFLARDAQTETIVLISKPPSPNVAAKILDAARRTNKNIVVDFIGYESENADDGNLHFAKTCDHAARLAVSYLGVAPGAISAVSKEIGKRAARLEQELAMMLVDSRVPRASNAPQAAPAQKYLRGLYSGGTLAYEAQFYLRDYLGAIFSNAPLAANSHDLYRKPAQKLLSSNLSKEHAIIDLGAEEFMVGRLHPMIDNDLRIRRLKQEADDPTVALILLDVVLGDGAHPDPARELAPAISDAIARAAKAGRDLQVVAVVIGTENDPQNYESQVKQLYQAGANLYATHETALQMIGMMLGSSSESKVPSPESKVAPEIGHWTQDIELEKFAPVDSMTLSKPFAAINVGIESFYDSLRAQNASAIHVDWKPPAGGNEKLMAILERLKG